MIGEAKSAIVISCLLLTVARVANSEDLTIEAYLEQMNYKKVELNGLLGFDPGYGDADYFYIDDNREYTFVTMDTGREVREQVKELCKADLSWGAESACKITGIATVEIDGYRIRLSLEEITNLIPQE